MNTTNTLILSLLAGSATFVGVFLGSKTKKSNTNTSIGTAFAGAIMLLISLFELLPEAYKESGMVSMLWAILGAAILWVLNKLIPHIHTVNAIKNCDQKCLVKMSYLLSVGLILHDFPEGFAIPSSFLSSSGLGFTLLIATFIHNIPEGYVLSIASPKNTGFNYWSAFLSSFSTILGSVLGIILIDRFSQLNSIFLSLAVGAMLFVSLHELIPESLQVSSSKKHFAIGASLSVIIFFLLMVIF